MLKRLLLITPLALLCCLTAGAQFRYTFKDTTTAYAPLSGGTVITGSTPWSSRNFVLPMPFSWVMDGSISLNKLPLLTVLGSTCADTSDFGDINGFMFADFTELMDRGALGTTSKSPIRYTTTGTTPSRIFKAELFNTGFAYENYDYGSLNDSANIQIWIYETSNIVELHYGGSRITHGDDYFISGTASPLLGYSKHLDFINGSTGTIYYVNNASAAAIDSVDLTAPNPPTNMLTAWPASGRVFRFTPKTGSPCTAPVANYSAGTPSGKTVQYTYTGTSPSLDSLVWNFGDGLKQKVTSNFAAPISHTFAANGHYNVCVTAYNSCGNNVSCKALALSVGDLSGLGNVRVFPNPASTVITIEGLQAGGSAAVYSLTGQQVLQLGISSNRQVVDLSSLAAGTYSLVLTGADGARGTVRLVRQ